MLIAKHEVGVKREKYTVLLLEENNSTLTVGVYKHRRGNEPLEVWRDNVFFVSFHHSLERLRANILFAMKVSAAKAEGAPFTAEAQLEGKVELILRNAYENYIKPSINKKEFIA